ncbi:pyridoxal phosphate-dependent aminotransferase [Micromonospora sp. NPDC048905]|uniref:pyridoxal phosphate-dependent aminotransferase n=1 Tax=Micromonospora TaxID=1873 RepID=UPI0033F7B96F
MTFAGSRRLRHIPVSGLGKLTEAAPGGAAVNLAVGTPGWPRPPQAIIEQAGVAAGEGHNQYADPRGNADLRVALARSFATPADPQTEITVTVGASEGLSVATLTLLDPGDEIVVIEPFYENFVSAIAMASATPRFVRVHAPEWRWDVAELEAAIGPRTRAILLNSPNNPTGRVLDEQEWAQVAHLCERHNLFVISDEAYAAYVFDGRRHISAADVPGLRERSIVVGSLSKTYAISGWRLGFLRAAPAVTQALRKVHMGLTGGTAAPLQQAVARSGLLGGAGWNPRPEMQALRDRAVRIFRRAGLDCHSPQGGCYVTAELGPYGRADCQTFVHRLAAEYGVLVAPGRLFLHDRDADSGFVRIAFNKPAAQLDAAEHRLTGLSPDFAWSSR